MREWQERGYNDALADIDSTSYESLASIVDFCSDIINTKDVLFKNGSGE